MLSKSLLASFILSSGFLSRLTAAGPLPQGTISVDGGILSNNAVVPAPDSRPQLNQAVVPVPSTNQDTIQGLMINQGIAPPADPNIVQNNTTKPRNIAIVAFRGWQPLDIMGPFDVLFCLSGKVPLNVYFLNKEGGTTTNFLPDDGVMGSKVAAMVNVDYTLADHPPLDVIIVPGGFGTRQPEAELNPYIDFVQNIYPSLQYLISVCTGASILARAGLLDGKKATTNKKAWKFVTQFGNGVKWQPRARYVYDQNIWTTSGVSAGTDGVLGWVENVWGTEIAVDIANDLEWNRSTADDDKFGQLFNVPVTATAEAPIKDYVTTKGYDPL